MKLLTKAIVERFAKVGGQDKPDAIVICKFFDPCGSWSWFATEYDPVDRIFFGLVQGFETELGSFSLDELESYRGRMGLGIERDLYWKEQTLEEVRAKIERLDAAVRV